MRDRADNVVIVCSIENFDPMGVHTGDSITVAPAQTLTDKEYQRMRDAALAIIREIGVETGGSNIQFAVNPLTGDMIAIEMNPRVSRSSALASKATGFPIAKIAAKLAVGYRLDELRNDITRETPACFEPTIDYVVTKMPRWAFEKFPDADKTLTTQMKSVGETMAIGRIWFVRYAFKAGMTIEDVHERTRIDRWFLHGILALVELEDRLRSCPGLPSAGVELLREAKSNGFSDRQLAFLWHCSENEVRRTRKTLGVVPVYKRVDTCAAEFEAYTPYYYSTYESPVATVGVSTIEYAVEDETRPPSGKDRIMILGGGPNRIGQGIEFDYCCCQAAFALRGAGYESIMVNSNPETVSTDYDTSDHLFFEPLTAEDVLNICDRLKPKGLIVQFGGQTPLNLARALEAAGAPIIGTSVNSIDKAEDRELFGELVTRLGLKQPENGIALDLQQALHAARKIGYPVLVRPSYVLGGRGMEIVYDESALTRYMAQAVEVSPGKPILIDQFLESAVEVDVDCLCDGRRTVIGGVMQHIEEAGIHSGDSACVIPPHSLPAAVIAEIKRQTGELAKALNVRGLMNVQFAIQMHEPLERAAKSAEPGAPSGKTTARPPTVFVLEVNPRASRTVPFVSKATGVPLARLATLIMVGHTLDELGLYTEVVPTHYSVKESVFPFNKFPGVDILLGPEMRSTGEVMGIDDSFPMAFAKSQLAANAALPPSGRIFISVADRDKVEAVGIARALATLGYQLMATRGTARAFRAAGIAVEELPKLQEGRPNLIDYMKNDQVALVINTPSGRGARTDEGKIRAAAVGNGVTCITTLAAAHAAVEACEALRDHQWTVSALQDRFPPWVGDVKR
jgi:carbamoyl-phosphate synthase large subunit